MFLVIELSKKNLAVLTTTILFLTLTSQFSACNNDDQEKETDTANDTAQNKGDTPDSAADEEGIRIGSLSGQLVDQSGTGIEDENALGICVEGPCIQLSTDTQGRFHWEAHIIGDKKYKVIDFENSPIHVIVDPRNLENIAKYEFLNIPTQEDISDQGEDDFHYDIGIIKLYELPNESVAYSAKSGASINLSDVTFDLDADSLLGETYDENLKELVDAPIQNATIKVFKAPLSDWDVPFSPGDIDALYYISPYWVRLKDQGISLTIEPPDNWTEGNRGTLFILGSFASDVAEASGYIYKTSDSNGRCLADNCEACDYSTVKEGAFTDCGSVTFENGKLITTPIPRFGWIGIKKTQ